MPRQSSHDLALPIAADVHFLNDTMPTFIRAWGGHAHGSISVSFLRISAGRLRGYAETTWVQGLTFALRYILRRHREYPQLHLDAYRYAIEAGATGLVLPQIRTRSAVDLADIMRAHRGFDHFSRRETFRDSLPGKLPMNYSV